ncbi:RCC1 domain-containing protein [Myxococcota bacterium]
MGFFTDFDHIDAGAFFNCALKTDGTVWCWGENSYGQLGDGTQSHRSTPVQVVGPGGLGFVTDVAYLDAGGHSSCAVKTDGTVWCWGHNDHGQLGISTATASSSSPVQVQLLADAAWVSGSGAHRCAVKTDGTVWCWGYNDYGQLGDGTTTSHYFPTQVTGLTDVAGLSAGGGHVCAVKTDGTAWCWGYNANGQLGDGTTTNQYSPTQVIGLANVSDLSAGGEHTCAVKTDGTLWCWGNNVDGQLGHQDYWHQPLPVVVVGF